MNFFIAIANPTWLRTLQWLSHGVRIFAQEGQSRTILTRSTPGSAIATLGLFFVTYRTQHSATFLQEKNKLKERLVGTYTCDVACDTGDILFGHALRVFFRPFLTG
jgi:hypothetical protein